MADFVAVIRKAVDGLANNTPENRSKVYEKARSAVVRQLENMKPRPPEELLTRQISKLDAAIAEVEGDYAEALPALEEEFDDLPAQDVNERYEEDAQIEEPSEVAPSSYAPEPVEPEVVEEPAYQAVEPEAVVEPVYSDDSYVAAEVTTPSPQYVHEEVEEVEAYEAATTTDTYAPPVDEVPASETFEAPQEPQHEVYSAPYDEPVAEVPADEVQQEHAHANWVGSDTVTEPDWESTYPEEAENPYVGQWTQHSAPTSALVQDELPAVDDLASSYTSAHQYDQDVNTNLRDPILEQAHDDRTALDAAADDIFGTPVHENDERDRRFDQLPNEVDTGPDFGAAGAAAATIGAATTATAASNEFTRYFDDALDSAEKDASSKAAIPNVGDSDPFAAPPEEKKRDAWDDLEDLIGYDGRKPSGSDATLSSDDGSLRAEGASVIPPNVYVKPKKNRTKEILFGTVAAVLIAGGAYALWENRAALNDMVGGLTESAQTETTPATNGTDTPAVSTNEGTATGSPAPSNDPASNGETTGTKFTQRLLTDGTEKDEGPAPVSSNQPVTAEGVSQMEQNVAPPPPATDPATATPEDQTTAPATNNSQTPAVAVAGERMFLYEEVLGQSVPTAIAGTAAWSLVNEQDADGKPSPTVQAQINVPDRGLTALLTFKKNTDASLPASHIIEIVFSTGPGFDGGVIDSVQRIAMKNTEQDRGNALVAVPAKITDDFHMIALNDFPDARKNNMDLLKNRDWIDIPLAYRNGRRALLTLQKGPAGKQAFETAIRDWDASTPVSQ